MGEQLIGLPEARLRPLRGKGAGFVFQQPLSALTPHLRIGAQLAESIGTHDRQRLAEPLADVGIARTEDRMRQSPHPLSGRPRRRLMTAIAVALVHRLLVSPETPTTMDTPVRTK